MYGSIVHGYVWVKCSSHPLASGCGLSGDKSIISVQILAYSCCSKSQPVLSIPTWHHIHHSYYSIPILAEAFKPELLRFSANIWFWFCPSFLYMYFSSKEMTHDPWEMYALLQLLQLSYDKVRGAWHKREFIPKRIHWLAYRLVV